MTSPSALPPATRPRLTPEELAARLSLLKDTLKALKPAPAKPQNKKSASGPSPSLVANTLAERFALEATGYKVWKALAKVVILEYRQCACGAEHLEYRDELYELENGLSHSIWRRHEGYGIEHQELLPIKTEIWPEVRHISACRECQSLSLVESALQARQQQAFPF